MLTEAFRCDAAALQWVGGPVVVLECVHELQHGAHSPYSGVNRGCANELS